MSANDARALLQRGGLVAADDVLRGIRVREIYVMLGFACNIRCPICPFWGEHGVSHHHADAGYHAPFNDASMDRFLRDMRRYQPRLVNIGGGEPLVYDHWTTVADLARRHGYKVMLTTNGSFLEKNLDAIAAKIDVLQVSFTDPVEWRRGFKNPEWAGSLKRQLTMLKQRKDFQAYVNIAVSDAGYSELESIANLVLSTLPVDAFRIIHPMFLSPEVLIAHQADLAEFGTKGEFWRGFTTAPKTVNTDGLVATIARIQTQFPGKAQVFPELGSHEVSAYYNDSTYLAERYRNSCQAPWAQVNVVPNGDVWVCYDLKIGNIHTDDVEAIWNGPAAMRLRQRILDQGLFAGCRGCFNKYSSMEAPASPARA